MVEETISNLVIQNPSQRYLSYDESRLLGLGMKFILHPPPMYVFFFNRDSKDSHYIKKRYIAMEDVSKISGEFPCTSESILTM